MIPVFTFYVYSMQEIICMLRGCIILSISIHHFLKNLKYFYAAACMLDLTVVTKEGGKVMRSEMGGLFL
jgi:hypothetical protein